MRIYNSSIPTKHPSMFANKLNSLLVLKQIMFSVICLHLLIILRFHSFPICYRLPHPEQEPSLPIGTDFPLHILTSAFSWTVSPVGKLVDEQKSQIKCFLKFC